ncbi:retrovirus-related pol polyprotein from transposon TNT 1-94 [Tanacetum coccineum]|uniref:Retrovirus-related pol polyprotein from transposon TNT 1-94 n=1 Tax=Tanacetum coccineum TaxID=301880 RepID=A0ABQ5GPU8_9ASTR
MTTSKIVELSTHTHFPIKLTANNFPSWRKQVLSTLMGLELEQFDQILLGALLGSCSDTIQLIVSSAETSQELFKRLTDSYARVSRSRIISLRSKLATNSKGTKPVAEYLNEMKAIADELALAQKPIDDDDLIVHILTHLGDDYKQITAALKIRDTPITFSDLYEKLVDHERSIQESQPATLIATVNNTQRKGPRQYSRPNTAARNSNRLNSSIPRNTQSPNHNNCRKLARFLQENNIDVSSTPSSNLTVNSSTANASSSLMFDSGASHHVTHDRSFLHNLSEYGGPDEIVLGNGKTLSISHTSHTTIPTLSRSLNLKNVLRVPQLRNHLVSVAKLCRNNDVSVEFFRFHFFVKDLRTGARLMRGVNINDIYYASPIPGHSLMQLNSSTKTSGSLLSWHHKFGHPSIKVLKLLLNNLGLDYNKMSNVLFHCDACSLNKSHKMPFGENSFKETKPLELIYSDVWGPVQTSNDGYAYYVIFVDFYSKYTWLYPIKRKPDVSILFPQFKILVEKFFHTPQVSLFSDNGGEYVGLIHYLQKNGISHFTTPPHTPEQNGVAERRHRHIVETGSNTYEDDLSQPWTCEERNPFTPRIRHFDFPKTRMPSHVKTYDGNGDPEDHLKLFQLQKQRGGQCQCGAICSTQRSLKMPANKTHQGSGGNTPYQTEDFMERYKAEVLDVEGASECMKISGFMHGITHPELIKREVAAFSHSRKKAPTPWRQPERGNEPNFKKGFKNKQRSDRKPDRFSLLTKTPKEIFALENGKFKAPPPMVTPAKKGIQTSTVNSTRIRGITRMNACS